MISLRKAGRRKSYSLKKHLMNNIRKSIFIASIFIVLFSTDSMASDTDIDIVNMDKTVSDNQTSDKKKDAQELDLGEYVDKMKVGERQLLSVTVLPTDASEQEIIYSSSDEGIAVINGMGRIEAKAVGTCDICIRCGEVKEKFALTVIPSEKTVTDIEISDYEKEVEVDKTIMISAVMIPREATEETIEYYSDRPEIATVNSAGEVKGIAPGQVTIYLKAGGIKKSITLTVKIATVGIIPNSTFVVLKPGEEFKLITKVQPEGAKQSITYKCVDHEIATVTADGRINAKSVGSTTVIVSNGDMSNAVTVIVNKKGRSVSASSNEITQGFLNGGYEVDLLGQIKGNEDTYVKGSDIPIITKTILRELYHSGHALIIQYDNYSIKINGTDITNYENEITTAINMDYDQEGIEFVLNNNQNLPGMIELTILKKDYKYTYLYNEVKERFERLKQKKSDCIYLDMAGKYKLTNEKINSFHIPKWAGFVCVGVVGFMLICYVIIKKRYWFW